ncbi:MAG: hypothetical protein WBQ66_06900 [Blastocatellia bacterium]
MNERVTIAAIVLLLAAGGLMQALSPAVQAMVGTYEAVLPTSDGDVRCVLSLAADATATFRTTAKDTGNETASYSGAWVSDGGSIQLVLKNPADPAKPVAVTLEPRDGAIFVVDVEGRKSPYTGLTFTRSSDKPPASESKAQENS